MCVSALPCRDTSFKRCMREFVALSRAGRLVRRLLGPTLRDPSLLSCLLGVARVLDLVLVPHDSSNLWEILQHRAEGFSETLFSRWCMRHSPGNYLFRACWEVWLDELQRTRNPALSLQSVQHFSLPVSASRLVNCRSLAPQDPHYFPPFQFKGTSECFGAFGMRRDFVSALKLSAIEAGSPTKLAHSATCFRQMVPCCRWSQHQLRVGRA